MIGALALLWLLTSAGRAASPAPKWPTARHPPPSRLPDKTASVKIGPAVITPPDAAPPMPPAATPPAVPEQEAPSPAARSAQQAARELYTYVSKAIANKQSGLLGTKTRPNPFVANAQRDMGVKPDGIYGPATRARGKALLQKTFPARVAGADRPLYIP